MDKEFYKTLGYTIRKRRKFMGMTQEELSEKAEICTSFVGHIEKATRIPSVQTLYRIAGALGVSLDFLFQDIYGKEMQVSFIANEQILKEAIESLESIVRTLKQKEA